MFYLQKRRWWPIYVGIAFACIELFSFYLSSRPLGASRGYTTIGSIITYVFFPEHFEKVNYWQIYEPYINWTMAVLIGIMSGSFFSSILSGEFKFKAVPRMWLICKGPSVTYRWFWGFVGGLLIGFGARLAMGCTLGMLIGGVIQLSPGGFVFMMTLWMGGVITTVLFYRTGTISPERD